MTHRMKLIQDYGVDVEYPDVSGFEILEMLNLRSIGVLPWKPLRLPAGAPAVGRQGLNTELSIIGGVTSASFLSLTIASKLGFV